MGRSLTERAISRSRTPMSDLSGALGPEAVAQLALEDLAVGVLGERRQELHRLRLLVGGQMAAAVLDDLALAHALAGPSDDQRLGRLAPPLVGNADHGDLEDAGMAADDLLDLPRVN